ncbi:hypothetical protein [Sphingomonas sp. 28-63-12]|uniref:hypothetical protein n=1 Tax=Sphingomonas sp. 28-63-12 TaxID=1970434 RepID=UPI0035A92FFB
MPAIIDMLMPASGDPYAEMAAVTLAPYHAAFASAGMTIVPRPWDRGPGTGATTLALFAWGYHTRVAAWRAMLAAWPDDRLLLNPAVLLDWNTRKTYLSALAAADVKIVPSWFGDADQASVDAAFDRFGVNELVVKPQISGGSYCTARIGRGATVTPLADAIIQPLLDSVGGEGELSIIFIGGAFSHAARKVAQPGEFRVQPQFGGVFTAWAPSDDAMAIARLALAALPAAPLYARVDLIRLADGSLALMELEAIEPDLYPDIDAGVPARLASAVRAIIDRAQPQ